MKTKKLVLLFFLCLAIVSFSQNINENFKEITQMSEELKIRSLNDFLELAKRKKWRTPNIWSRWHVDKYYTKDKKKLELLNRSFGYLVAEKLQELAEKIPNQDSSLERYERAKLCVDLADWIGTEQVYGNALLAMRANDIGIVELLYATADTNFPLKKVSNLMKRINMEWTALEICTQLLNQDSGMKLYQPKGSTSSEKILDLSRIWDAGSWSIEYDNKMKKRFSAKIPERYKTKEIQQNPELFCSTIKLYPYGLVHNWDIPTYDIIAHGFDTRQMKALRSLVTFREEIGGFPTNFPPAWKMGSMSDEMAAFRYAWNMHIRKMREHDKRHIHAPGAIAYTEIKKNALLDKEASINQRNKRHALEAKKSKAARRAK